ncbi:MAG TPA: hypothetical protein VGR05_07020, partial [Sphingomicrobium sp.]|nr:hypothetical protein [Sphingomicrobium sp.]
MNIFGSYEMYNYLIRGAVIAALVAQAAPILAHGPVARVEAASVVSPAAKRAAATVDAFHAALRQGDTRSAVALLADQVLIFESGGVERSKAEYESHHLGADAAFAKAVPMVLTRRLGE